MSYFVEGLPNILSKNEEDELFEKFILNHDINAREQIINHNLRLVLYICKRYATAKHDTDDLTSIGIIGLIKALDSFNITKNTKFAIYAGRCIENEILMFLRNNKKTDEEISLDASIGYGINGEEVKLEEFLSDDTDIASDYEEKEYCFAIRKIIEQLPELDRKIMKLYYGFIDDKTHTAKKIAKLVGYSRGHIYRIIDRNLVVIRAEIRKTNLVDETGRIPSRFMTSKIATRNVLEIKKPKFKTIYELLGKYGYDRSQIDKVLVKLGKKDKALLKLRYGDDLDNPVTNPDWNKESNEVFYNSLLPRIRYKLKNFNNKHKKRKYKGKPKLKTIYNLLAKYGYNKSQVDEVLSKLDDEDKALLKLKYGDDLNNPINNPDWDYNKHSNAFYYLITRIKNMLKNPNIKYMKYAKKNLEIEATNPLIEMQKKDYEEILQMLKFPSINQLTNILTPEEVVIIALKLGKNFSTKLVSELLNISEEDINSITEKMLLLYNEDIGQIIDQSLELTNDKSMKLLFETQNQDKKEKIPS